MKKIILAILVLGFAVMIAVALSGCKTTKDLNKTTVITDNSRIQELEEESRMYQNEINELQRRINEMEYTGVVFDNDCDSIIKAALVRSGCNMDSINSLLSVFRSRIKVYADGSAEYEGTIRSYTNQKSRYEELLTRNEKTIDSLKILKEKVQTVTHTVTNTKTVYKKKSFLSQWWLWLIFFLGGLVLGFKLCWKYKDSIIDLDKTNAT